LTAVIVVAAGRIVTVEGLAAVLRVAHQRNELRGCIRERWEYLQQSGERATMKEIARLAVVKWVLNSERLGVGHGCCWGFVAVK
jgi:hypothetical protein